MSMTLQEMIDQHEALPMPESADDDVLDDLIFMAHDQETMVLGYAEAMITGVSPGFELDASRIEKHISELNRFDHLNTSDTVVQIQLLERLTSLVLIRDYLKTAN